MFKKKKYPTISMNELFETYLTHTIQWIDRNTDEDLPKLEEGFQAIKVPVDYVKTEKGLKVRHYFTLDRPQDLKKVLKKDTLQIFSYIFGNNDIDICQEGHHIVVELPNCEEGRNVCVADVIDNDEYRNAKSLKVGIGIDMNRNPVLADLEKMPHMLVAGTTGSGKSVFMHQLIASLLINHSASELELYLVDPKMVEFPRYGILHNCHIVSETESAITLLSQLCEEMDNRYILLSKTNSRDIDSYNAKASTPMSRKVIFIDELADLILTGKKDVETSIVRIAQKARACGIHLVIATQRPDRTIVTGLIKANIPVKVCLRVSTGVNSRIILDKTGGEKLLGKGDMLYLGEGMLDPIRLQGGFLSEIELNNVIEYRNRLQDNKKRRRKK